MRVERSSNAVTINVGPPPFELDTSQLLAATAGQTLNTLAVAGTELDNVTPVEFAPPEGITASNLQSSSTTVTLTLALEEGAAVGTRMMSLVSDLGRSNWIPFEVQSGN